MSDDNSESRIVELEKKMKVIEYQSIKKDQRCVNTNDDSGVNRVSESLCFIVLYNF